MQRKDILIEVDELIEKIDNPNLRIYDASINFFRKDEDKTEYERYLEGHIPGAAFFDHKKVSDADNPYQYMIASEEQLEKTIGSMGISAESEVIFYTDGLLPTATRAWWVLRYAGHDNVRVLNGGLPAWKASGGELETTDNHYEATTFVCKLRPEMFATKEDVLAAMDDDSICTVNTLNPEWYAKEHITGSSLLSCMDLLHDMSSLISDDELTEKLQEEAKKEKVITYCGGGFAATVNAVAHLIAGNENVAVYDGSLSEWTGENLPITTGANT